MRLLPKSIARILVRPRQGGLGRENGPKEWVWSHITTGPHLLVPVSAHWIDCRFLYKHHPPEDTCLLGIKRYLAQM